jgi:hypothetical protein
MQKKPLRTELLWPVFFTANEVIAVGAAITTYQKWLARSPESAHEHRETIQLLDHFQHRLTQLPNLPAQEASNVQS